jgi:hypothetical protein
LRTSLAVSSAHDGFHSTKGYGWAMKSEIRAIPRSSVFDNVSTMSHEKHLFLDKMVCLLDSQDEKTVAMLRKSLDTITMERDAAFISRVRDDIGYSVQSWAVCSTFGKACTYFSFYKS